MYGAVIKWYGSFRIENGAFRGYQGKGLNSKAMAHFAIGARDAKLVRQGYHLDG